MSSTGLPGCRVGSDLGLAAHHGSDNTVGSVLDGLVLPDAHDGPSGTRKTQICLPVARDILLKLVLPEGAVGDWKLTVSGAGVPEASVDEDRDSRPGERNVGSRTAARTWGGDREIDAEPKASSMKRRAQRTLGPGVHASVRAHRRGRVRR